MISQLDSTIIYEDISPEILDHDLDVVSDLWEVDGRNVYRGSRDPHYSHANVYWLYDENMIRVGLNEHDLTDHANFKTLWIRDDPFSTFFQEDWKADDNIWSKISNRAYEKFLAEGWTTPTSFLEHSLNSEMRVVTMNMIRNKPAVYECTKCNKKSLSAFECGTATPLTFPKMEKVFFVDEDMMLYVPPENSKVFTLLV